VAVFTFDPFVRRTTGYSLDLDSPCNENESLLISIMTRFLCFLLLILPVALAQTRHVAAIAHRGEHLHHPENTMPAFEEGEIAKMTLEQVRALDAGVKMGPEFAGTKVPTFDEVLDYARGKIDIYVDVKQVTAKDLVDHIVSHGMAGHVVIYSGRISKDIQQLNPALKIMPESVNADIVQRIIAELHPKVIAFGASDWKPEIIKFAKDSGAELYVDRQGADRNGPTDNPESWQAAIDAGADGIQTDRPGELVKYLRAKGYKQN
jgi:glycerophosphoryl diester phosphodiesterase